jgi:glycosyltransferase involved in cell wall biosynthesis
MKMKHVIIMPAHNEAEFIGRTLRSLAAQTERPDLLIVVDDGSTDATAEIVRDFTRSHDWIRLVRGPKHETRRYKVVEVFNRGYDTVRALDFEYVSKIDADLEFPPDYFERLFSVMDRSPDIAAGSGIMDEVADTRHRIRRRMPENHVPGPLKTIRKSAFDEMGGFLPSLGWDIVDLVKIRALGYRTINLPDLVVLHMRLMASANGVLRGNVRQGHGAYVIGTHPLFAIGRTAYRMFERPYVLAGLALGYGYFKSWLSRAPQIEDKELIRALRHEQLYRLFHLNRLPHLPRRHAAGRPGV